MAKADDSAKAGNFDTWISSLGATLPANPKLRATDKCGCGCNMKVWLTGTKDGMGNWIFQGESDSNRNRGITKIVIDTFTGLTRETILQHNFHSFRRLTSKVDFQTQRGIQCMVNQIHSLAR